MCLLSSLFYSRIDSTVVIPVVVLDLLVVNFVVLLDSLDVMSLVFFDLLVVASVKVLDSPYDMISVLILLLNLIVVSFVGLLIVICCSVRYMCCQFRCFVTILLDSLVMMPPLFIWWLLHL